MSTAPAHEPAALLVPQWTFGDRIRKARRHLGLEQEEFATAAGVPRPRLGQWESGQRGVKADEAALVARRLQARYGISAAWLLGVDIPVQADSTMNGTRPVTGADMVPYRGRNNGVGAQILPFTRSGITRRCDNAQTA